MSRQVEFSSDETVGEARTLVRAIAGPRQDSDDRASMIARAAYRLGWSGRRTKSAWYGECRLLGSELDTLRTTAAKWNQRVAARTQEAEATHALLELQKAIARAQGILAEAASVRSGAPYSSRSEDHEACRAPREERRSLDFLEEPI